MPRSQRVAALLAVTLAACTRDARRADIDSSASDLVVHAVTDDGLRILDVQVASGDESAALSFGEGQRLYSFVIDRRDLVAPDGTPLDDAALAAVRADTGDLPGACGRCLAPAIAGSKVVYPGESCPPPAVARSYVHIADEPGVKIVSDDEGAERVREALRLTWDGDCPCDRFSARLSEPATVCPIAPERGKIRPLRFRLLEDGTIVGFNQGFGIRIAPDGTVLERPYPPSGPVEAVSAVPGSTDVLLVTSNSPFIRPKVEHHLFDTALEQTDLGEAVLVDPSTIVQLEPGALHLVGETLSTLGNSPGVARCTYDDGRTSCTSQSILVDSRRCPRATDDVVRAAVNTPSGDRLALLNAGHVLYQPAGSVRWYCDPDTDVMTFPTSRGDLEIDEILGVHTVQDRIYMCTVLELPADERIKLGAVLAFDAPVLNLDPDGDPGRAGLTIEVVSEDVFGFCRDMIGLPGGGFRVIEQSGFGAVDFDAAGQVTARHERIGGEGAELWPEIPHVVVGAQTSSSGWTLAVAAGNQLYRRAPGAAAFEPVYAADPPAFEQVRAMVEHDGAVWTFLPDGALRVSRDTGSGCDAIRSEAVAFDPPLSSLGVSFAVALRDSRTAGRVVLVGQRSDELVRADLDLDTKTIVSSGVVDRTTMRLATGVELAPGKFLLVGRFEVFALLDDDGLEILTPEVDDPTTSAVEALATIPAGARRWLSADGRNGAAWVGGFGDIARVTVDDDGATVETFWLNRMLAGDYAMTERGQPPELAATQSFCPDEALFLAFERVIRNEFTSPKSEVRGWFVGDDLASLDTFAGFGHAQDEAPSRGARPAAIVADDGRLDLFFDDSVIYRNGTPRTVAPFPATRVAARGDRFTLFGGPYGRIAAVVETP